MEHIEENVTHFIASNSTEVSGAPNYFSSVGLIFIIVVFAGFIFSLVTTLCLLFTKEVQKGDIYITLSTMTLAELIVYLTFLILLCIASQTAAKSTPYLCLCLNTTVGLFKGYSLSLAVYLTTERVIAMLCPNLFRVKSKKASRHIVQVMLFIIDSTLYLSINLSFGQKDTDAQCTTPSVYAGKLHQAMTTLRAITLPKMILICIMCLISIIWIRKKMTRVGQIANRVERNSNLVLQHRNRSIPVMKITVEPPTASKTKDRIFIQTPTVSSTDSQFQTVSLTGNLSPAATSSRDCHTAQGCNALDGTQRPETACLNTYGSPGNLHRSALVLERNVTEDEVDSSIGNSSPPFWMMKSYKTVSYYLFSYIIIYLPSMVYITVMLFDGAKEDATSRAINFLAPCIHSVVGSFIYMFRVREIGQKLRDKCRKRSINPMN